MLQYIQEEKKSITYKKKKKRQARVCTTIATVLQL